MSDEEKVKVWMPLFIGAYLADTQRLSTEQHGAYLLLIMDYWMNGAPADDDEDLAAITKLSMSAWRKTKAKIVKFFTLVDGHWVHKRIDEELMKARHNKGKAAEQAIARWGDAETPERGRHLRAKRLAEARLKGTHTTLQWELMKAYHEHRCVRCGSGSELVKDHIQPIYQGGSDGIENIQPLCRKCNSSKGPEAIDLRRNGWFEAIGNAFSNASENASDEGIKTPHDACSLPTPLPTTKTEGSNTPLGDCEVGGASVVPMSAGLLSRVMREFGIQSNPADPRLIAIAEQGVMAETVRAACEDAKRSKKGQLIYPAYVFSIIERWAAEASKLNANGAKAPAGGKAQKFDPVAYVNKNRASNDHERPDDYIDV